jgi:anti-sigma factor RsiW
VHISRPTLVALADGELGEWRRRRVERHLDRCQRCRAAANERLAERDFLEVETVPVARAATLPDAACLLAAVRESGVRLRLAEEARRYFGAETARLLEARMRSGGPEKAAGVVEPLLATFLGERTAAALVRRAAAAETT